MPKKKRKTQRLQLPKVSKVTQEQVNKIFEKIMASNLDDETAKLTKMLIEGNAWITRELERGKLTIAKLRKLFQIQGSEKVNRKPKNDPASLNANDNNEDKKGHGRNNADAYKGATVVDIEHPDLSPGDTCPEETCGGRLYEMSEPGTLIRVSGAPLATATRYNLQKLRCAICDIIYTAPVPKGVSGEKYDANFIAMLMINKYFMSVPLYRQDRLQNHLGIPLPASTQWTLMYRYKGMFAALFEELFQDAADGEALIFDDTSAKVLSEIKKAKAAEKGKKKQHTCFTTGVVSLHEDHHTYLYITDNRAAGKCIAEILSKRDKEFDAPVIMCDALLANIPQDIAEDLYVLCYCLVHARRQFYELPDGYDDLADKVIGLIGTIYDNEAQTKGLSKDERLAFHQEHSASVMAELKAYLEAQEKDFEPNSIAGKAIDYVLDRWTELSHFLQHKNAPLDTNIVERALKLIIQVRKASMFYKTLESAAFASHVQSAIYSAAQNDINPCDYLRALIENEKSVTDNPEDWLPWDYQKTLKQSLGENATQAASQPALPD